MRALWSDRQIALITCLKNLNVSGTSLIIFRRLFVTCDVFARYFFVAFPWLFWCLFRAWKKQCLGVFRGFFVVFLWLFCGFFVALISGKFYAYSPWKSLLNFDAISDAKSFIFLRLWLWLWLGRP